MYVSTKLRHTVPYPSSGRERFWSELFSKIYRSLHLPGVSPRFPRNHRTTRNKSRPRHPLRRPSRRRCPVPGPHAGAGTSLAQKTSATAVSTSPLNLTDMCGHIPGFDTRKSEGCKGRWVHRKRRAVRLDPGTRGGVLWARSVSSGFPAPLLDPAHDAVQAFSNDGKKLSS